MPSPSLLYILGPKQSTENMLRVILGNAMSILKVGIFFLKIASMYNRETTGNSALLP